MSIQASALVDTPANRAAILGSDMRFTEPYRQDLFCMFLTDEFVEYHTELDNYFVTNMLAYIMGDKDIDATWDAYVEEYLNMAARKNVVSAGCVQRQLRHKLHVCSVIPFECGSPCRNAR